MQGEISNYLSSGFEAIKRFGRAAVNELHENLYETRHGFQTRSGSIGEAAAQAVRLQNKAGISTPPSALAGALGADIATDASRRLGWKWSNVPRMAGELGKQVAKVTGMDPLTGAVVATGTPAVLMSLSGTMGSPLEGFRPKGYKAVAPKSKEEDPTGRETMSVPVEAALRYFGSQRSQILPYEEFKKERPDVLAPTYRAYRRYEYAKAKPGELVTVNPEDQSFATVGGLVRGTARGLNDPEIRVKGFPVTASGAIGTAAGLGAASSLYKALPQSITKAKSIKIPGEPGTFVPTTGATLGVLAAGLGTAALVGAATKKLFAKAEEQRVKKENPVEYLKGKHGDLASAAQALGQPQARSWQELTPLIK